MAARRKVEIGSLWTENGQTFEVLSDPIPGNELREVISRPQGVRAFMGSSWFRRASFVGMAGDRMNPAAVAVAACECSSKRSNPKAWEIAAKNPASSPKVRPNLSTVRKADGSAVVAPSLAKASGKLAIGRWYVLRSGGKWNANVREAVRGRNFVYAVREVGGPVLYVGEAHSAKWKRPKLVWEEIETVDVDDRGRPLPICALPKNDPERKRRARVPQSHELRGWKTLLHHFQDPKDRFRDLDEWTWHRKGDLEIAIWFVTHGADYCEAKDRALGLEYAKTLRLKPLHTSITFKRSEAPF